MRAAVITVAGISSRFNEGIEEDKKCLKAIYTEGNTSDTLLSHLSIKPSLYWPLSLQMECPVSGMEQEFVIRGILVSLAWLFFVTFLGALHFQKADIT